MSATPKVFKKGDFLFKEGDKIQSIIFIQAGSVNQCLQRGKKNVDLFQLGSNQVLGEGVLIGHATHTTSAVASAETKVIEIAPDDLLKQFDGPTAKLFVKSMVERLRAGINEVKGARLSGDAMPCAPELVPQVFSAIFYTAQQKGSKVEKSTKVTMDWTMLKAYAQRVFGQSPKRLEQAVNVLVKLKLAEYVTGKLPEDPKGPDVIVEAHFNDLGALESFFEFFQYYYYKPGKSEILKYDEFCAQMLEVFVEEGLKGTPGRHATVTVDFAAVGEKIKEKMGVGLNNDHFARLEAKGVLCKRKTVEGRGAVMEFELREFQYILFSWRIIREIDRWNEKGFVDPNEKEERKAKKSGPCCPQCSVDVAATAKFCQECGTKIVAAA